ncbi:hypothetical protein GMA11_05545 [Granulicatella sp. zg-ZJ]|uniref:transposase n=1 Tax=Granulicatella sp. zg-ZJ TaxID=2678504 RepID=UPI0013D85BC9|nr:hypothetical protein [Granulicatella sp. zg-ZJ]
MNDAYTRDSRLFIGISPQTTSYIRCRSSIKRCLTYRDFKRFEEILIWAKQEAISPGLRRVLKTFKGYLPYIKNTFIYHHFTNGTLEGINNAIKALKRNTYGYRNFSHFRNRILLMCKLYVLYTVPSTSLVA